METDETASTACGDTKLRELVLYITWFCRNDGNLSAAKVNKILFYSDFAAYLQLGKPITGQEYFALPFGLVPKRLLGVRQRMEEQKERLTCELRIAANYQQQPVVSQRKPDLSIFGADEIAIVDQVLAGRDNSTESHVFVGWVAAEIEVTVPPGGESKSIARRVSRMSFAA